MRLMGIIKPAPLVKEPYAVRANAVRLAEKREGEFAVFRQNAQV